MTSSTILLAAPARGATSLPGAPTRERRAEVGIAMGGGGIQAAFIHPGPDGPLDVNSVRPPRLRMAGA